MSKKKRKKKRGRGPGPRTSSGGGGVMTGMVGGFRRAVGVGKRKKKRTLTGTLINIALLLALAALVFWRFFSP